jgi:hypothetical protein
MYIDPQDHSGSTIRGIGYIIEDKHYAKNARMVVRYQVKNNTSGVVNDFGFAQNSDNPSNWTK